MKPCAGCKKPIKAEYIQALDGVWHQDCLLCAVCGHKIAGKLVNDRGKPVHPLCHEKRLAKTCCACGQLVVGPYTEAMQKIWHPGCFVCAGCGGGLAGAFLEKAGQPFHEHCYHARFTPKCSLCSSPLMGRVMENWWGDHYCGKHDRDVVPCTGCSRPISAAITGGGVRYRDGRQVCMLCRESGVDDLRQVPALLDEARLFTQGLGLGLGGKMPLTLVFSTEISTKTVSHGGKSLGLTETRGTSDQDGHVLKREVTGIKILHGLPKEQFQYVLVHELGHAWFFIYEYDRLPSHVEEGMCNLFASLWLKTRKNRMSEYYLYQLHGSDDPVYGAGFRSAEKALACAGSLKRLLAYIKIHKSFDPMVGSC